MPCARRLDGRVEREQVRLDRQLADHGDEPRDLRGRLRERRDLERTLGDEPLGVHETLHRGLDRLPVLGGDHARAPGRLVRLARIDRDSARAVRDRRRHIESALELLGLLGDRTSDLARGPCHRFTTRAQRARGERERLELAREPVHSRKQRVAQVEDVDRRGELVGDAADQRRFLGAVRAPLVHIELEHADLPVAELQRHHRA